MDGEDDYFESLNRTSSNEPQRLSHGKRHSSNPFSDAMDPNVNVNVNPSNQSMTSFMNQSTNSFMNQSINSFMTPMGMMGMNNDPRMSMMDPRMAMMDPVDPRMSMRSSMGPMMTPMDPFMPPQTPDIFYNFQKTQSPLRKPASSILDGLGDGNRRNKTVAFQDLEPEYPSSAYKGLQWGYEDYEVDEMNLNNEMSDDDYTFMNRPLKFTGDDYNINPLQDIDGLGVDGDEDPFDDESLFSEASDLKRGGTVKSLGGVLQRSNSVESESSFKPKLNYSKTIKRAKLINGNYVIDCPVPKALLDTYGKKITDGGREMSLLRYSAVTCGPSNFMNFKYTLRQALYNPKRETEIMCVVTMYNEDEILLAKTLQGIFKNIENLTNRKHSSWGENSWKKIVIVIVSDGRAALNPRSAKFLKALGIYQETFAKSKINNQNVKSHVFEYTSTVGIETINEKIHLTTNNNPVQFIFCLKEKNTRKINSHRWCFQSFGPIINPRIVMLLDCGTVPAKDAFYHLWRLFNDTNVAGACGEMRTALGVNRSLLINPLVAAQNFEYKISNVLDKPMESVFGFITVLPGAFSAYRYEALLNVNGKGPLEKYFKGEFLHSAKLDDNEEDDEKELREKNFREVGIFTSNMYLAEDRILCFELVAKKGYNYILRYVNEAKAETDVPETIEDFVLQRRRWLNGSLFAACYAIFHWTEIWKTQHSLLRKFVLQLEFYYQLVVILVSWFSLACFYLVFDILTSNLGSREINLEIGKYLSIVSVWLYVAAIISTFVLAFGNTPRGTKKFYLVIAIIFAILMVYMLFAAVYLAVNTVQNALKSEHFTALMLVKNEKFRDLVISTGTTYLLYFFGAILYGEPSFMATSFIQYLLLSPTYVNVLNIYSFCNIDDISWGTRQEPVAKNLGVAKSTNNNDILINHEEVELNEDYLDTLEQLRVVPPKMKMVRSVARDDNYYALIRTCTVLVWLFTNLILICIVLEIGGVDKIFRSNEFNYISPNSSVFLTIILWLVAGLAAYRFFGSVLFLVFKLFRPIKWKLRRKKPAKSES